MATPQPSRRPKLSLQTKTMPRSISRATKMMAGADPRDPTSFNTLSNVYVTAIERSTPIQFTPLTAINVKQPLRVLTDQGSLEGRNDRVATPSTTNLPETPISANPMSPAQQQINIVFPSTMTATPPMSAGTNDSNGRSFSFKPSDLQDQTVPSSPAQTRRRAMYSSFGPKAPYARIKGLRGILRNSPLPPSSAVSPVSPRRQSLRLQEKAARRVGYQSPIEQTITTQMYTRSHIDLLVEEASPYSPNPGAADSDMVLDLTMAYTGDETRDGGQTPGPFEEMRRRMAGMGTESPALTPKTGSGVGKRKRKEKKRRWVWTIGNQEEGADDSGAMVALRAASSMSTSSSSSAMAGRARNNDDDAATPRTSWNRSRGQSTTPEPLTALLDPLMPEDKMTQDALTSIEVGAENIESASDICSSEPALDIEMSDADDSSAMSSRATTPHSTDGLDMITPTVKNKAMPMFSSPARRALERLGSVDGTNPETGTRRDTPIPEDLVAANIQ